MPQVGKKKFAYNDAGQQAAFEYAEKTGEPIMDVNQFGEENAVKYGAASAIMEKIPSLPKKKKMPRPYKVNNMGKQI